MKRIQGSLTRIALAAALAVLTGCQTYNQQNTGTPLWKAGQVSQAATEFTRKAQEQADTKDTVVWRLEQGTALRALGQYAESLAAFEQAERRMDDYETKAKVRVSNEAGALLTTQANLPYQGRDYDKVMLCTYKALDYLQLGQFDKARPEFIRAYQHQQDAVENNKKRIEKAQADLQQTLQNATNSITIQTNLDRAREDPKFTSAINTHYSCLDTLKAYADFVNPLPVYLDGLYFFQFSTGGSDLERARKSFERAAALTAPNKFVQADLEAIDKALRGEPPAPVTYVLFETGCAPWRDEVRIDILLPDYVTKGNLPYVGAAFPLLRLDPASAPTLTVSADGVNETTLPIVCMDNVVAQDFKNELPTIITKTILSTTIKAVASYEANRAASQQSELAGFLSKVTTSLYQEAVNIADTRTWTTLPKEVQICRIPTPANQVITLSAPGVAQPTQVKVEPGTVNLICVKSISPAAPLLVSQTKLKSASLSVSQACSQ